MYEKSVKTRHNAIEHVFMSKLIKINISINMYDFLYPVYTESKQLG